MGQRGTCAVPRLVLTYSAQMQIYVEMSKLSKKTQFHVALFIALFLDKFSLKPVAWVPFGISLQKENATAQSGPAT